ncbi:MAG: hypothetical protein ABMA25_25610, partial [Ilumatobacteraceae bacterium]
MQPSVFDSPKPALANDEIARLAHDLFGIDGPMRALESERDQNVQVGEFVVKIANAAEDRAALELQHAALAHLAATDPLLPL